MYVFYSVYGWLVWYRNFLLQAASQLFAALNHYVACWRSAVFLAMCHNQLLVSGLSTLGSVLVHSNSGGSGLCCVLVCSTLLLCILSWRGGSLCRYCASLAAPSAIVSYSGISKS